MISWFVWRTHREVCCWTLALISHRRWIGTVRCRTGSWSLMPIWVNWPFVPLSWRTKTAVTIIACRRSTTLHRSSSIWTIIRYWNIQVGLLMWQRAVVSTRHTICTCFCCIYQNTCLLTDNRRQFRLRTGAIYNMGWIRWGWWLIILSRVLILLRAIWLDIMPSTWYRRTRRIWAVWSIAISMVYVAVHTLLHLFNRKEK